MNKMHRRLLSMLLCVALLMSYTPLYAMANPLAKSAIEGVVVDPSTAGNWESMMGTDADGNRYAGRVWVDRSVYKNGDTVVLNSRNEVGSTFQVSLEDDEAFQVVFSALGSTMTTKETKTTTGPMDVVLILDNSVSMNTTSSGMTRMQKVIEAANTLLGSLLDDNDVRLGITAYAEDASVVLPFDTYENGVVLKVNSYTGTGSRNGVITAYNKNNQVINNNYKSNGYANYTNTQAGFELAMEMLSGATNTANRKPVVILLTDGAANTAVDTLFDADRTGTVRQVYYSNDIDPMIALSTLLNAAYHKANVEDRYGKAPLIYGVGVDLSSTDGSNAIIDPAKNFNGNNTNDHIVEAYETYTETWLAGKDVSVTSGTGFGFGGTNYTFRFGHEYPQGSAVTDKDIASNINYVDIYYPVSSQDLESVFNQIYLELSSGVFNPISSTTVVDGGTGVENTPLIYVDFIGQHMEVKEIQSISLFGASYGVIKKADGTYTVDVATGVNPTTNEVWNTAEDIQISIVTQADGTQKLEICINQEILPIILEQVEIETVGQKTTSTITEFVQDPLRVYYTVGVDADILLPNGKVDVSKIQGYQYIDDTNGTVSFYSNQFGKMNPADKNGVVTKGDAHVGFQPSAENRYYYHQANQRIFSAVTRTDDQEIKWEDGLYGVAYDASDYQLTDVDYKTYVKYNEDYEQRGIDHQVYTYVKFWHPTASQTDAANAAEEVTYLVYTNWSDLRESVAFYDATAKTYLNDGKAVAADQAADVVETYMQSNPNAQIYAVLGMGSHRTSRLHNMAVNKIANNTQTAVEMYTPEYTYETATAHHGNDVVVWLGNNGKLTVEIDTGIALTKTVTEAIGNGDDTYALTVTVPAGVTASPVVVDAHGNTVVSTYAGNVLTVHVKAGETVYISGIPGGTQCAIDEIVKGDYYIASKTDTVTVPLVSQVLNGAVQFAPATVTNAPYKYGNLFITKEITSDHAVPESVLDTAFTIVVDVGTTLAGETFTVEDSAHSTPYSATVDNAGNLTFQIKARQTVEILGLPAGTAVTVTEAVPDNCFAVSYRTRNHSGETADSDNAVVISPIGNATAVVMNHYTPKAVSVALDIVGTKNFVVEDAHAGGTFTYQVQKWNGTAWEDVSGKTAQTTYAANESGIKTFTITDVLEGVEYNDVGDHAYQVIEVKGNVSNVTYDRTVFAFDVVVSDVNGQLVATVADHTNTPITDGTYEVSFTNTYHTAPVSLEVEKIVENESGDNTISKAGFAFKAISTDAQWNALTGAEAAEFTVYSDATGSAQFSAVCTKAGTYYFVLGEEYAARSGWTYSTAEYRITVTVVESNGELSATLQVVKTNSQNPKEVAAVDTVDASRGSVTFVNTYNPEDASVNLDGKVVKELTGKTLEAGQFTFCVYEDGNRAAPLLVGKNDQNGLVDFDLELTLTHEGVYYFDVVEAIPVDAVYDAVTGKYILNGMRYDPTIYDLVVEVTHDAQNGRMLASWYFEDAVSNTVTFHNSYSTTPTTYTLSGTKVLHGRALRADEFTFELYEGTELLQTETNKADGNFTFQTIAYTQAGTYTYIIKEAKGDVAGVSYDGANKPVTVVVTVVDVDGALKASANIQNADIKFENTYTAKPAQVTFNGTKELKGGALTDNAFAFKLYKTDHTFDITKDSTQLLATAKNISGAFSFAREFAATGTYYFAIVEDTANPAENIVYDHTVHKFAVYVSDVGDGQLQTTVTNMITGVSTAVAASASVTVGFVNATFEEAAQKEVYYAAGTTTQIDGQKVKAGDILTYFITYTNYTGENVVVDIMDTIPNHTTYVEGTASHGSTYAGEHLNWVIAVARGESVTVSFSVKVNADDAIIANTAVVRDGINTYKTNEVVNHTIEKPLVKDVYAPEDLTTSIDGKKVSNGDALIYRIRFTNASGKPVNVKITDNIPKNTTYVADSADNGGVYADGAIVWNLTDIPAWSTVTVAFQVTVTAEIDCVITNQAVAEDGENTYTTNQVSNIYTAPEPLVDPEVPTESETPTEPKTPANPGATNPKTGDSADLTMWFALLFVSCGGFVTMAFFAKKKEQDEMF